MHQGHPFRAGVRSITESAPPSSLRAPVVGLRIGPGDGAHRARAKLPELESLLESVAPDSVRLLEIEPASQLDRVPRAVSRFSQLQYAHVAGRKLRDYSALASQREVKSLFVTGYREATLWPMPQLALDSFRSIGDSLTSCALSSKKLWFQRSKLQRFDGGVVDELWLEKCPSLDHDSIRTLTGLRHLTLMGQRLVSLDFLAASPSIRMLDIFALPKSVDVDELVRTTTIERVFLGTNDKVVERIGAANPRLAITNGEACFIGGKPARHFGDFHPTPSRQLLV